MYMWSGTSCVIYLGSGRNGVAIVLDKKLKENEEATALVHPLHNKATLGIKVRDLIKFMDACKHAITWIDCQGKRTKKTVIS